MVRKLIWVLLVGFILTAMSPAPLPSVSEKRPQLAESSQAVLAAQQKLGGSVQQIGEVPRIKREDGSSRHEMRVAHDQSSSSSMLNASERADTIGKKAIVGATDRIESESKLKTWSILIALTMGVFGFAGFKAFQRYVNKVTPVPKMSKRFLKQYE
jgi:hypothetical protein